jgi:hypothetical protein
MAMKLRSSSMAVDALREVAQEALTSSLADEGWRIGKELDDWSSVVHTVEAHTTHGPFVPVSEIRCALRIGHHGETLVEIEQTRHTWLGKGSIVDAKRANERFDALVERVANRLPVAVEVAS